MKTLYRSSVETTGDDIYDLSGNKVSAKEQGLYIVNGKKYIKR